MSPRGEASDGSHDQTSSTCCWKINNRTCFEVWQLGSQSAPQCQDWEYVNKAPTCYWLTWRWQWGSGTARQRGHVLVTAEFPNNLPLLLFTPQTQPCGNTLLAAGKRVGWWWVVQLPLSKLSPTTPTCSQSVANYQKFGYRTQQN